MSKFDKLYNALRFVGLPSVLRSIAFSVRRDRLDRQYPAPPEAQPSGPGEFQNYVSALSEALLRFSNRELHVRALDEKLLCFTWDNTPTMPPYAIARSDWPGAEFTSQSEPEGGWRLHTPALDVFIQADGALQIGSASGSILFRCGTPSFHAPGWTLPLTLEAEERIYGLGERAAPLNRRGRAYRMWNQDPGGSYNDGDDPLYVNIPVYIGLHPQGSYLVFIENTFDASYDFGEPASITARGGPLRFYFAAGTPRQVLAAYHELTGKTLMPPRWALGYHQSRWGYKTEADVRELMEGFRQHDLPISAVHLDIDYMKGYRLFSVDKTRFPDLTRLSRDLAEQGVHLVTILDVGIKTDMQDPIYQEGLQKDAFCKLPDGFLSSAPVWPGECAFPDFTHPAVRAWWGGLYRGLLDAGISGFWHDMNEPAAFTSWGEATLPACTRHNLDGQPGDHRQAHNLYGLLINRAAFEGLRVLAPDKRPWMVTRSGWAGMGRYTWKWTGDVNGTWEMLRRSVSIFLGLSLSGVSFVGSDVGGFSSHPSPELFVRWFQLGAFSPFFRTHSATGLPRREPWQFDEEVLAATRAALHLRQALMPYLYTSAWFTAEQALPILRPLFWDVPAERALWDVDDAFLLGDSLLVAPVLQQGQVRRSVSLPAGTWYESETDNRHAGSQTIQVEAPLERVPWFVRAGKILPMESGNTLQLDVYAPEGEGETLSWLYCDAGDGYGASRLDTWSLSRSRSGLELGWESQGEYTWPYETVEVRLYGFQARAAVSDGRQIPVAETGFVFDKPFRRLSIQD